VHNLNLCDADRMKLIRDKIGLTQKKLCETIGIPENRIKTIETGRTKISIEIALALEQYFNFSFKWVLTGIGDMFLEVTEPKNTSSDNVVHYETQIEKKHMELIKDFRNKERARRFNQKLLILESLSDGLFDKAESTVDQLIETAEIVVNEQEKKKTGGMSWKGTDRRRNQAS